MIGNIVWFEALLSDGCSS